MVLSASHDLYIQCSYAVVDVAAGTANQNSTFQPHEVNYVAEVTKSHELPIAHLTQSAGILPLPADVVHGTLVPRDVSQIPW